jgi:PKD repeat protein
MKKTLIFLFVMVFMIVPFAYGQDADTVLLIQSDTYDGDTFFEDVSLAGAGGSGHIIDVFDNAQHSIAQQKFGASSMSFDGSGDYLSIANHADWHFGGDDFTIDFWAYPTNWDEISKGILGSNGPSDNGWMFYSSGSKKLKFYSKNINNRYVASNSDLPNFVWTHVAVVRSGNTIKMYFDGNEVGSESVTGNIDGSADLSIGKAYGYIDNYYYPGYIDELRISKGIARWTENFTPPTAPYGLVAKFSASPISGYAPLTVDFTDLSGGVIDTWEWDFGDEITSAAQSPSHTYPSHTYYDPGVYSVGLTVWAGAESDTMTKMDYITVFAPPDLDEDGVPDVEDNCPGIPNTDQLDSGGAALGDACDLDYLRQQIMEALSSHQHIYYTGEGKGHNNVEAVTGGPE